MPEGFKQPELLGPDEVSRLEAAGTFDRAKRVGEGEPVQRGAEEASNESGESREEFINRMTGKTKAEWEKDPAAIDQLGEIIREGWIESSMHFYQDLGLSEEEAARIVQREDEAFERNRRRILEEKANEARAAEMQKRIKEGS